MTVSQTSETGWRSEIRFLSVAALKRLGPFALAGVVGYAVLVGFRRLSVPLADLGAHYPNDVLPIPPVPEPLAPVGLTYEALPGLKPLVLAGAVGLWALALLAVTVAAAVVWWWTSEDANGTLPPLTRLVRLGSFALIAAGAAFAVEDLVAGYGVLTWGTMLLVAFAAARLWLAPVAVVLDGRGPLAAVRWSDAAVAETSGTLPALGLVVGIAALRYATVFLSGFLPAPTVAAPLVTVVGTTVFGWLHAASMRWLYGSVIEAADSRRRA